MTPKEKAVQLRDIMSSQTYSYQPYAGAQYNEEEIGWEAGKKCALIAVSELLKVAPIDKYENLQSELSVKDVGVWLFEEYWLEVKEEIEKL